MHASGLAVIARNNFYFYFSSFCAPASSSCAPVLLRLVLMSSCVVVLLLLLRPAKCISVRLVMYVYSFKKLHTFIGLLCWGPFTFFLGWVWIANMCYVRYDMIWLGIGIWIWVQIFNWLLTTIDTLVIILLFVVNSIN